MALPPVFLDTWAVLALVDRKDPWHQVASDLSRDLDVQKRHLGTTTWVLTEFLNAAAKPPYRQWDLQAVHHFQKFSACEVVPANQNEWIRGLEFYESRSDKDWSLVDCLSILACQDRGITDVFTGDHRFEQAGLNILLRRAG